MIFKIYTKICMVNEVFSGIHHCDFFGTREYEALKYFEKYVVKKHDFLHAVSIIIRKPWNLTEYIFPAASFLGNHRKYLLEQHFEATGNEGWNHSNMIWYYFRKQHWEISFEVDEYKIKIRINHSILYIYRVLLFLNNLILRLILEFLKLQTKCNIYDKHNICS